MSVIGLIKGDVRRLDYGSYRGESSLGFRDLKGVISYMGSL